MLLPALCLLLQALPAGEVHGRGPGPGAGGVQGRSVLVMILDDVALDDWQDALHPNLDLLAQRGLTFANAHANGTCSPSRRALMTGEYWMGSSSMACAPWDPLLDPPLSARMLPELAPQYASALFGKWHLGGDPKGLGWEHAALSHGYDTWQAGMGANVKGCDGSSYVQWRRCDDGVDAGLETRYEPTETVDALIEWWRTRRGPKLAVWAPQLAHAPFHVPPPDLVPDLPIGLTTREKYLAMIQAFDVLAARVIDELDLARDLVIVVGDNGTPENLAPPPYQGKVKGTTFRRGTQVPLLVLGANQARASTRTELVHIADVYATVAAWVGVHPRPIDGQHLLEPGGHPCVVTTGISDVGVRSARHFLRRTEDGDELYDLVLDPLETVNRIDDPAYDAVAQELRVALEAFLARR